jgi:CAAX prenyl protease-like protein
MMALDPVLRPLLSPGFDGRWLYGVRVLLALVALVALWRHYTELTDPSAARVTDWALSLGVGAAVFALWIHLDFKPVALTSSGGFDPYTGVDLDLGLLAVRLAGATLIVPVMEELFWRSFILRWLHHPRFLSVDPTAVGLRALIISSALFATEHRLWFAGLLAGLAYGWLFQRSGNLWVPVVAHAVTNGLLGVYVVATGTWSFW